MDQKFNIGDRVYYHNVMSQYREGVIEDYIPDYKGISVPCYRIHLDELMCGEKDFFIIVRETNLNLLLPEYQLPLELFEIEI